MFRPEAARLTEYEIAQRVRYPPVSPPLEAMRDMRMMPQKKVSSGGNGRTHE